MKKAEKQAQKEKYKSYFLEYLEDGSIVYTVCCTVARSGLSRTLKVYCTSKSGEILNLTFHCSVLLGYSTNKDNELRIGGCGLDVGSHLVDQLGTATGLDLYHRWL